MKAQYIKTIELDARSKFQPAQLIYEPNVPIEYATIIGFICEVHDNSIDAIMFEPVDLEFEEGSPVFVILAEVISWEQIYKKLITSLRKNPKMANFWQKTFDLPDLI